MRKLATNTAIAASWYWVSTESEDSKSKNYASDEQLRALLKIWLKLPYFAILMAPLRKVCIDHSPSIVIIDKQAMQRTIGGLDQTATLRPTRIAPDKVL